MPFVRIADDVQHGSTGPSGSLSSPAADQRLVLEHAKGALMMRYGVDSYQALAVLAHWSRASGTPLAVVAHTLVRGICEGNPQTAARERALVRWLEQELRQHDVDVVRSTSPPVARRH